VPPDVAWRFTACDERYMMQMYKETKTTRCGYDMSISCVAYIVNNRIWKNCVVWVVTIRNRGLLNVHLERLGGHGKA
jgi:hypothetical protein